MVGGGFAIGGAIARLAQSRAELVRRVRRGRKVQIFLFPFPGRRTHPQPLQHPHRKLHQTIFGSLEHNQAIGAAADHLFNGQLVGADHLLGDLGQGDRRHNNRHHPPIFHIKFETAHLAQQFAGFGNHLAADQNAVNIRIDRLFQGILIFDQDHIANLADAVEIHEPGNRRDCQQVILNPNAHHFTAINIHPNLADNAQTLAGVAGDNLGSK